MIDFHFDTLTDHEISLVITVRGSTAYGEIYSNQLSNFFPKTWQSLLFEGIKSNGKIKGFAYDYIGGKQYQLGEFQISLENPDAILVTSNYPVPYFPDKFRLMRSLSKPENN